MITERNGKKIHIILRQIHTRKLDRLAAKYYMRREHRQICKHGYFALNWREYVPK